MVSGMVTEMREEYIGIELDADGDDRRGYRSEGSGWYEPFTDDRRRLFRSCQREYGRCVSRMYTEIDTEAGPVTFPIGWVFRSAVKDGWVNETWIEIREREGEPA